MSCQFIPLHLGFKRYGIRNTSSICSDILNVALKKIKQGVAFVTWEKLQCESRTKVRQNSSLPMESSTFKITVRKNGKRSSNTSRQITESFRKRPLRSLCLCPDVDTAGVQQMCRYEVIFSIEFLTWELKVELNKWLQYKSDICIIVFVGLGLWDVTNIFF